ncbi:protein C12orf4 homolog isoform X2 [Homarus americanus]|uniref:C12orf4-like n=2 Tax=Homarus americanus TaxID=6706 RepID=A0A8J5JW11_HOMAM|nr:protein C12orf4 homolog isoform X2 [Homarus americanus]KAG7162670.1 C12orf4-like [Homarus americanus]
MMGSTRSEDCMCEVTLGTHPRVMMVCVPITIPSGISHVELAHRLVLHHNLPIYLHTELSEKLQVFIQDKTEGYYRQQDQRAIQSLRDGKVNIDDVASAWTNKYSQIQLSKRQEDEGCENEMLATMYHSLVHSPMVVNLLSLEHSFAGAMSSLVSQREYAMKEISERQTKEMSNTVSRVGVNLTDDDVNDLAAHHLEDSQLMEVQWDSTISVLRENQKREFMNFVMESFAGREVTTPVTPKDFIMMGSDSVVVETADPTQEESFTIHLGAQMKQMHNLRLLSAHVLQLCKYQSHEASDIPPQRIQTSMSLYSHNLNGLVLLVDDRINTYSGIKRDFGRVCSRSTELHFPDLEDQLESVRDTVPQVVQWRRDHPPPQYDCDEDAPPPPPVPQYLKAGDFYITRHSNLADVHVVFHMIVDDSLHSGDINSRHPVILGLRNVLKVACLGDITTLTIPLLLTNTMSEEMTMSWCQKRAELVYKCVKGFMMEMASWGGAEMKNMQFLVPKGISEDLFQHLAAMLPNIFRVSNPLVVKSS